MKKTMTIILLFGLVVFISSNDSIAGQLYKWVDENGVKHFSDSPTDRDALEKSNFKSMPAFKRVEPVSQKDEVTKINARESTSKDHAINQHGKRRARADRNEDRMQTRQDEHRRRADRDEGRMQNQQNEHRRRADRDEGRMQNRQNEHRRRADRDEGRMQNRQGKRRARAR